LHEGTSLGVTANLTGAEDIIAHHDSLGQEWGRGGGIGRLDGGLGDRHVCDCDYGGLEAGDVEENEIEINEDPKFEGD
jgi:hypothetical protein